MSRNYLWASLLTLLMPPTSGSAASRVERGNLIFDNVPEAPAATMSRLDGYLGAREATPWGWSAKGELLIATRFGDADQLHIVAAAGGARRQITFEREPITEASFSPDPARSAYLYLKGGGDDSQLYYQRLGEPSARLITDLRSRNGAPVWSNSGREIAFVTTARDGASHDIDVVEPETGSLPHLVLAGDDSAAGYPLDWSPDDRKLLVLKYASMGEGYLYVVDLGTGQKREVDPSPGKVGIAGARFSRDGQGVYLISDRDSEFAKLRYANLFTSERRIVSDPVAGDVEELAVSRDGHYLAYVSNEAGLGRLNLVDLKAHQDLSPPRMPPGLVDHLRFDAEGKRLAFRLGTSALPRDAYVLDIAANAVEAWTHSEPGAVDATKIVTPRLAQFPTFDRIDGRPRQIPMYVYEPASPGPHPVLLLLNGGLNDGPEEQFRPAFDPWIQYVVNELGYAVVAPNLRGSSGYGKAYRALDDGQRRDDVVKDVGALIVWVDAQTAFDARHVVAAGRSYGGYLALAALVNYSDRLSGGVDLSGISDFVGYLAALAPDRQKPLRAEYGDERDPEMRAYLRRISPLTNADRIARPLLVVHGRNDPSVPIAQADQMVNRLRSRGGDVWYLQAVDAGPGFRNKPDRDASYRAVATFLKSLL